MAPSCVCDDGTEHFGYGPGDGALTETSFYIRKADVEPRPGRYHVNWPARDGRYPSQHVQMNQTRLPRLCIFIGCFFFFFSLFLVK
ncbi:hypothetical protein LY78DRAFT_238832 [Colletotrichum sublineola]|nr:hypothetical protein LY78DRAFT_238832 [Colletotrichum sublineola]